MMMTRKPEAQEADPLLFSAVLTPQRSLAPNGFRILMGVLAACSFATGLVFWRIGAWPVPGFIGLDVVAVYLAFRYSYRSGRAFEEVELRPDTLKIRKVDARGRAREFRFQPYWARLEVERSPVAGMTALYVTSHGRRLPLGRFLGPDDRESFADALQHALRAVRNPPLEV